MGEPVGPTGDALTISKTHKADEGWSHGRTVRQSDRQTERDGDGEEQIPERDYIFVQTEHIPRPTLTTPQL